MTKNQKFYIEQVIDYLNLLHEDTIFTQNWTMMYADENHWEVEIQTKNSAYVHELNLLVMLLDAMHPRTDNRPEKIKLY